MVTEAEQKKQAVEDAIQEYVRATLATGDETLIVTDWVVGYNVRQINEDNNLSAVASFTSNHSSIGMLLGLALTIFEKMKKDML